MVSAAAPAGAMKTIFVILAVTGACSYLLLSGNFIAVLTGKAAAAGRGRSKRPATGQAAAVEGTLVWATQPDAVCKDDSLRRRSWCTMCPLLDAPTMTLGQCKDRCAAERACTTVNHNRATQQCRTFANCTLYAKDEARLYGWGDNVTVKGLEHGLVKDATPAFVVRDFRPGMNMVEVQLPSRATHIMHNHRIVPKPIAFKEWDVHRVVSRVAAAASSPPWFRCKQPPNFLRGYPEEGWTPGMCGPHMQALNQPSYCTAPSQVGENDKEGDGAWWVCMSTPWWRTSTQGIRKWEPAKPCVVYSIGTRDNWSFDTAMVKLGCEVHGFDPSIGKQSGKWGEGHFFHDYGVGGENGVYGPGELPYAWPGAAASTLHEVHKAVNTKPWQLYTLPTIMRTLKHTTLAALKFDVEGFEWYLLEQLMSDTAFKKKLCSGEIAIDQIMFEAHFKPPPLIPLTTNPKHGDAAAVLAANKRYFQLINMLLDAGYTMWRLQLNGWACYELSFVFTGCKA